MTTNNYFDAKGYQEERGLISDIVEEFIQFGGFDVYYIPRIYGVYDKILGEDNKSTFGKAISIEAYLEDHSAARGQSEVLSKFGFEIRDNYTVSISPRRFRKEVISQNIPGIINVPREGDLIYFDLKGGDGNEDEQSITNPLLLEIKFFENEKPHYQLGRDSFWELDCEMFRYNNEEFKTGIKYLDNYSKSLGIDSAVFRIKAENGSDILLERGSGYLTLDTPWHNEIQNTVSADNDFLQEEAKVIVEEFTVASPFGKF